MEEEESQKDYLDIWRVNPSYKERNITVLMGKIFIISVIALSIIYFSYYGTYNVQYTVLAICFISFLLFFDQLGSILIKMFNVLRRGVSINPFEDLQIITIDNESATLLLINRKTSINIALRVFKVDKLPESVQPTLNQLLKALNNSNINFTYQVIQNPIIHRTNQNFEEVPSTISIYFSVTHSIYGILRNSVIQTLLDTVKTNSNILISNLVDNIHHTKVRLLQGAELLNALRIMTFNHSPNLVSFPKKTIRKNYRGTLVIFKHFFTASIIFVLSVHLSSTNLHPLIILVFDGMLSYFFIFVWWRDLLYFFSHRKLYREPDLSSVDIFPDIAFFRCSGEPGILFARMNDNVLMASRMLHLNYASQPMLAYPDKFFRALNYQKVYFNYTVFVEPCKSDQKWIKGINEKTREHLIDIGVITVLDGPRRPKRPRLKYAEQELSNWLRMRTGIWKTFATLGLTCYREMDPSKDENEYYWELQTELNEKSLILKQAFEDNFLQLKVRFLYRKTLLNAFLSSSAKNLKMHDQNSKLACIYFQGKTLMNLIAISNELKKGLETKIAAEFNTPLHLINDIVIGSTLNTEVLEPEVELGFTLEQVKQLLITNGLPEQREATAMRIVTELIKSKIPCVLFDFTGNWSKILLQCETSDLRNSFLYFKLGTSFSLDLINSEIPYDNENIEYLNLLYDVFSLAFKADKSAVDLLRLAVAKNKEIDLNSMELDQKMQKEILHREYNSLIALLQGIEEWKRFFNSAPLEGGEDVKALDFIRNETSIIIDFSLLNEINQKLFASFVIVSKFIHYAKYLDDYRSKILVIPYIDLYFDAYYIDNFRNTMDYGKINKFLGPLLKKGFGFIFSANQIRYLHPNVLNYFPNIITYKATDSRDIAVLKSQMNLQELHDSGYYSSKRNNTYQIETLMNLQEHEALIKRSDIYQPFPGIIEYANLDEIQAPSEEYLNSYMFAQGYDLKTQEARILAGIKKTLFEKDLGIFSEFTEDIIQFLSTVRSVDNVGGLTESKLKTELFNYIHHTASKRVKERAKINDIRNTLFQILTTHGYLIEAHPKRASGADNIRTCYQVGPKYRKAVDDFYDSKKHIPETPRLVPLETEERKEEIVEKSSTERIRRQTRGQIRGQIREQIKEILNSSKFKHALISEASTFIYNTFQMNRLFESGNFTKVQTIGTSMFYDFFANLQNEFNGLAESSGSDCRIDDINDFVENISEENILPLSRQELSDFFEKYNIIMTEPKNIDQHAKELRDLYDAFTTPLFNLDRHLNRGEMY